ncbi:hypothetical protein DBV15_09569 [Temnothorax longispinosus]|uniref:Uncharacterized protein n=1 Tax=Temnothorax longispinosus TaxID=300112 RepID=A0A4S2KFI1_9HYME|nr:hypothetical protein DBV15_09569 [Temnothorax longispinosus]
MKANYFFAAAFTVFAVAFFGLGVLVFAAGALTAFLALDGDLGSAAALPFFTAVLAAAVLGAAFFGLSGAFLAVVFFAAAAGFRAIAVFSRASFLVPAFHVDTMYFLIAWKDEPLRSLSSLMAAVTISEVGGRDETFFCCDFALLLLAFFAGAELLSAASAAAFPLTLSSIKCDGFKMNKQYEVVKPTPPIKSMHLEVIRHAVSDAKSFAIAASFITSLLASTNLAAL